ncbi:hypothetical protein STENM223S_06559 [Streptomyces tendae]
MSTPSRRARWLVPALLLLVWLGIGGALGPYAGKLGEVATNDRAAFLPRSAESTRVVDAQKAFQQDETLPVIVVWTADRGGSVTAHRAEATPFPRRPAGRARCRRAGVARAALRGRRGAPGRRTGRTRPRRRSAGRPGTGRGRRRTGARRVVPATRAVRVAWSYVTPTGTRCGVPSARGVDRKHTRRSCQNRTNSSSASCCSPASIRSPHPRRVCPSGTASPGGADARSAGWGQRVPGGGRGGSGGVPFGRVGPGRPRAGVVVAPPAREQTQMPPPCVPGRARITEQPVLQVRHGEQQQPQSGQ